MVALARVTRPLLAILLAGPAWAGSVDIAGPFGSLSVPVVTLQEQRFTSVVRQRYDYSCGAAAVATLLTHHYERAVDEKTALEAMLAKGDEEKIRLAGFSLADLKGFLEDQGFTANGYRMKLDNLARAAVPVVALITMKGYSHFVVVRGLRDDTVLVGDPALGARIMPRADFEAAWNGVVLAITSHRDTGHRTFNRPDQWRLQIAAPIDDTLSQILPGIPLAPAGRDYF